MSLFKDEFEGCIEELKTWFQKGTEEQRDLLITSIRNMSDLIDEDMPNIIEEN